MKNLLKKVAYLNGLVDGLKLDMDDDQTELLVNIIDVLDEFAYSLDRIFTRQKMIFTMLDTFDRDLRKVECNVYAEDEDIFAGFDDLNFDSFDDIFGDNDYYEYEDEMEEPDSESDGNINE